MLKSVEEALAGDNNSSSSGGGGAASTATATALFERAYLSCNRQLRESGNGSV
jgi:hypothetical protein